MRSSSRLEDALPFECQRADRRVVGLVLLLPLMLVVRSRPLRLLDGTAGEFVERLAQKLRADKADMHPLAIAAGLGYRRDPAVALHLVRTLVALPPRSESHNHPRYQGCACTRQRCKQRPVGMCGHLFGDAPIENG